MYRDDQLLSLLIQAVHVIQSVHGVSVFCLLSSSIDYTDMVVNIGRRKTIISYCSSNEIAQQLSSIRSVQCKIIELSKKSIETCMYRKQCLQASTVWIQTCGFSYLPAPISRELMTLPHRKEISREACSQ